MAGVCAHWGQQTLLRACVSLKQLLLNVCQAYLRTKGIAIVPTFPFVLLHRLN